MRYIERANYPYTTTSGARTHKNVLHAGIHPSHHDDHE